MTEGRKKEECGEAEEGNKGNETATEGNDLGIRQLCGKKIGVDIGKLKNEIKEKVREIEERIVEERKITRIKNK